MVEHVKQGDDAPARLCCSSLGAGASQSRCREEEEERGPLLPALGTRHVRASSRAVLPGVRCFDSQLPGAELGGLKRCCRKYLGISVCSKWHQTGCCLGTRGYFKGGLF